MTMRTTTVGQEKRRFRGVLVMTAATMALLGGVVLVQLRPTDDAAAPTTTTGSTAIDRLNFAGSMESHLLQERYDQAEAAVQAVVNQAALSLGGMAELYAEPLVGGETASAVPVTIDSMVGMEDATMVAAVAVDTLGGMAELYREQQAAGAHQPAASGGHRTDIDERLEGAWASGAGVGSSHDPADQHRTRVDCGDGVQPALCY